MTKEALLPSPSRPVRVIAIASGKGGVGKTTVAINLALALAARRQDVMLLDADLGLANVDVMLGLRPRWNLAHVIDGECSLEDTLLDGPGEVKVIPASSGIRRMAELSAAEQAGLVRAFSGLSRQTDCLIVDTPAGISHATAGFCAAAQEVVVVVRNEPASITDAYALVKVLNQDYGRTRFRVLVNMAQTPQEGLHLHQKLLEVTERFLDVSLDLVGTIPDDPHVRRSIQRQRALLDLYPVSPASFAFKKTAERSDKWPVPRSASGSLEFFVERLVEVGTAPRRAFV